MANTIPPTTLGITGTDGKVAVYDGNAPWKWWNKKECFDGTVGAGRYVPKIGDYAEDTEGPESITYKVVNLDPTTLIPTYEKVRHECSCEDAADDPFSGNTVDSYRVYLDTSVTPFVLSVDARFQIGGTDTSYVKIFLGSDISAESGKAVSFLYDNTGQFLTHNVPLELVTLNNTTNHALKRVKSCNTNRAMRDAEEVTVVAYNDLGKVIARKKMWVVNTSFIMPVDASQKYITKIGIKTPYLSDTDDHIINIPMNTHIDAFNFIGLIHYSDGSTVEVPVDGVKFRIMGLENFISTVPNQSFPIDASYMLSNGEVTYNATSGEGKFVTEPYQMTTIKQEGAYIVKLYGYPVWVDSTVGYQMKWFLYNLDRGVSFEVTPYVYPGTTGDTFDGKAYGKVQNLTVRLNLRDVSMTFKSYQHVQTTTVVLREPGTERTTNWTIAFEPYQDPLYGVGLRANARMNSASNYSLRVGSGALDVNEWLQRLYLNTKPLIDRQREVNPVTPNFFAIELNGVRFEYPISQWNSELVVTQSVAPNSTLFIEFIKRANGTDLLLGVAGLPVYEL